MNKQKLLTEEELLDVVAGVLIVTNANNNCSPVEKGSAADDAARLISDHRRLTEAIADADVGQYCPFCQRDYLEHASDCIFLEVTNGRP